MVLEGCAPVLNATTVFPALRSGIGISITCFRSASCSTIGGVQLIKNGNVIGLIISAMVETGGRGDSAPPTAAVQGT